MAKVVTAFADSKGKLHSTACAATISDLAELFGHAEGMATGIARTIMDKREEIEHIFSEYDEVVDATIVASAKG